MIQRYNPSLLKRDVFVVEPDYESELFIYRKLMLNIILRTVRYIHSHSTEQGVINNHKSHFVQTAFYTFAHIDCLYRRFFLLYNLFYER